MAKTERRKLAREVARRWPELGDSAADLIAAGAVVVDGIPRTNPDMLVAATDSVRIDDQRRPLRVGTRTTVRLRARAENGQVMRGVRVIARGPGIRTGARTNARGVVSLTIRPRSAGVVRFRVRGSTRCVLRMGIAARFQPPVLTG